MRELEAWGAVFDKLGKRPGVIYDPFLLVGIAGFLALRAIDAAQQDLEPLANFILPGGSYPGAYLHVARTVCRRAERLLVAMRDHGDADISPAAIAYLNRLSDALFVWARWVNARLSSDEHIWNKASAPPPPA